jgi:hypothetical protein
MAPIVTIIVTSEGYTAMSNLKTQVWADDLHEIRDPLAEICRDYTLKPEHLIALSFAIGRLNYLISTAENPYEEKSE